MLGDASLATDPRYASNPLRCANRAELDAFVGQIFAGEMPHALIARLEAAGTAWARLNGVDGLSRHSQLRRVTADTPTGPVALPASPIRWDGEEAVAMPVPALGADDEAIRAEFV